MSDEVIQQEVNFGRRIPDANSLTDNKVEQLASPSQVVQPKKEGLNDKPVISKELFTEINLFVPQVIGLVFSVLIGFATILITRVMSVGLVENLKDKVTEEVYLQLSSNLNTFNSFVMIGVAVPVLIYAGFLAVKFFFMMPRKDRNIVARIFNSRAILFSVENVKPKMLFNPKDKKTEVMVDNPSKHYDYLNGRPVVCLRQEDRTNVGLIREDIDPSGKGRDIDSMVGNALHTGYEIAREQLAQRDDKTKVVLVLLIIILAVSGLTWWTASSITPNVIDGVVKGVTAVIGVQNPIPVA